MRKKITRREAIFHAVYSLTESLSYDIADSNGHSNKVEDLRYLLALAFTSDTRLRLSKGMFKFVCGTTFEMDPDGMHSSDAKEILEFQEEIRCLAKEFGMSGAIPSMSKSPD